MATSRVAGVLVALALSGTAVLSQGTLGSGTVTAVSGDAAWKIYRNPQIGFEVELPAAWIVTSAEPFGEIVEFQPPSADKALSEFSFGPVQPTRDAWFQDFDAWLQRYKRELAVTGSVVRSEERLRISGYQAVRLTYVDRTGPTSSTTVDVLIAQPRVPQGLVFRLFYGPPAEPRLVAAQDAIYRRVLSSLRISAPK